MAAFSRLGLMGVSEIAHGVFLPVDEDLPFSGDPVEWESHVDDVNMSFDIAINFSSEVDDVSWKSEA